MAGDLGIDIFGAANDCRIFRLIGLLWLDCQKGEWKLRTRGECSPRRRTAGDSSLGRWWGSKRTSGAGWRGRDGAVRRAVARGGGT